MGGGHLPDGVTLHDHQRRIPAPPNAFPDALPQCSERLGSAAATGGLPPYRRGGGARHLATVMGRDPWEGTIPMKELPKVWQKRLDAADVEDVLCHFKDALRQLAEHRVPVYGKSCGCPGGPAANGYDVP